MMEPVHDLHEVPRVGAGSATHELVAQLVRERGCVIVESVLAAAYLAALRLELKRLVAEAPVGDNDFDGRATRRIFDPLARTRILDDLVLNPLLSATVEALIGPCQFGMTIVSEIQPGQAAQRLHRDASVYPLPAGTGRVMVNTIWAMDDFTRANGATVLSPGSHLSDIRPGEYDPASLAVAAMSAGSVLVYDGRLVHGAGGNDGESARLGLIIEHAVRWLRPAENHQLAVPPTMAVTLPTSLQELLGYNQHGSYLGFVAGQAPRTWLSTQAGSGASAWGHGPGERTSSM